MTALVSGNDFGSRIRSLQGLQCVLLPVVVHVATTLKKLLLEANNYSFDPMNIYTQYDKACCHRNIQATHHKKRKQSISSSKLFLSRHSVSLTTSHQGITSRRDNATIKNNIHSATTNIVTRVTEDVSVGLTASHNKEIGREQCVMKDRPFFGSAKSIFLLGRLLVGTKIKQGFLVNSLYVLVGVKEKICAILRILGIKYVQKVTRLFEYMGVALVAGIILLYFHL